MRPIFIFGVPRSGTTLLGAMLGAPDPYLCVPEAQFKEWLLHAGTPTEPLAPEAVRREIERNARFRLYWEMPVELPPGPASPREAIERQVLGYGRRMGRPDPEAWIDQSPDNFRYLASLGEAFPEARMIHIVRDGRGVAASVMRLSWGPNGVVDAAGYWLQVLAYCLAAETIEGLHVTRVRYEDLVADPPATLERLCARVGLDYHPSMAEATGFRTPGYSATTHALVGSRPDATRADAWERSLSPREVEIFEALTGEMLAYLGYPLRFANRARLPSAVERRSARLRELYLARVRNPRRRRRQVRGALELQRVATDPGPPGGA